jgi:hypothetical protein
MLIIPENRESVKCSEVDVVMKCWAYLALFSVFPSPEGDTGAGVDREAWPLENRQAMEAWRLAGLQGVQMVGRET